MSRITVVIEGGIVQAVVSNDPALVGLEFTIVDYDTEGADEISDVKQGDGSWSKAVVSGGTIEQSEIEVQS